MYELLRGTTSNNPDIVVITNLDKDTSENSIIEMTVTGADDNKDDCNHNIYEGSKIRTFDEFTKVLLSVRKTILTIQINKWGGSGSNPF